MTGPDVRRPARVLGRPAGRLSADRCSVRALARGDSGVGTASPAQRWLLVEQPGPWGVDALTQSRFDPAVAPRLAHRAREEGVRVLLVRRPGDRLADTGRRWAYADGRPGREGLWWSVREDDADIVDAPWDGSAGRPADGPTYLVCAHGGHDACCAVRGRPLAQAMPADDVWECSHLGGCRFAANVLVLPHGFYYGQVPGDGAPLVAAHAAGEVAPSWLRGRSGTAPPVQAAQQAAREELGLLGVDDLPAREVRRLTPAGAEEERWVVTLAGPHGDVVIEVASRPGPEGARLTCRATHDAHPRLWSARPAAGRPAG
ncbi:sucrase ferredoxin [Geodermatophilus marinus]|uniref:sucrase ferredoxin n=1 Tax=Geodermatophilus sp. LHW52908 TaxID=2303986 RepID=UPI000E3CF6A7|nr:sucrase ferredoxin [Geodermatophilus sp. LHW52908]RFU22576.1 sucrase ferredoxin [Geodermatophilus sp. LHW52908]